MSETGDSGISMTAFGAQRKPITHSRGFRLAPESGPPLNRGEEAREEPERSERSHKLDRLHRESHCVPFCPFCDERRSHLKRWTARWRTTSPTPRQQTPASTRLPGFAWQGTFCRG